MQKAHADIVAVTRDDADTDADDDASTKGVHAAPSGSHVDSPTSSASQSPTLEFADDAAEISIPTIRISTESAREETLRAQKAAVAATVNGAENINGVPDGLQQPVQAAAGEGENKDTSPGGQESFSFSNKRLCERWLDNLFMVLYEVSQHCSYLGEVSTPCARTYESGRFSARKSRTSKRSTWHTARRVWNGRFSATSVYGFIIRRRPRKRSSGRWTLHGTRSNHGQSWWTCTRKKAT